MAKSRKRKKRIQKQSFSVNYRSSTYAGRLPHRLAHLYRNADRCEKCGAPEKSPCRVTDHSNFARKSATAVFHAGRKQL